MQNDEAAYATAQASKAQKRAEIDGRKDEREQKRQKKQADDKIKEEKLTTVVDAVTRALARKETLAAAGGDAAQFNQMCELKLEALQEALKLHEAEKFTARSHAIIKEGKAKVKQLLALKKGRALAQTPEERREDLLSDRDDALVAMLEEAIETGSMPNSATRREMLLRFMSRA